MIVNDMCNKYKTTNNLDFWNVSIDTTNTDTNIKLKEYTGINLFATSMPISV